MFSPFASSAISIPSFCNVVDAASVCVVCPAFITFTLFVLLNPYLTSPVEKSILPSIAPCIPPKSRTNFPLINTQTSSSPENSNVISFLLPSDVVI